MSDQYTSNAPNQAYPGSLVDNSMKPENAAGQPENYPPPGDTTSSGGYGGDPFSRKNQAPGVKSHFHSSDEADWVRNESEIPNTWAKDNSGSQPKQRTEQEEWLERERMLERLYGGYKTPGDSATPMRSKANSEKDFEIHAGEGVIPPNQRAAAEMTSSGVPDDAFKQRDTVSSDEVGA
ncbi:hypothetical protein FS837_008473 [Tulasnella sp. UAMH 9824]|nr:hypothetical protein FS837_008473 [Tulasnella sp. UAMH 9824]